MANEFWMSDRQWTVLEPLVPMNPRGAKPKHDREIISGVVPYFTGRLPLARMSGGVRPAHDGLQSVQPMVEGWHLADDAASVGGPQINRISEHRQHHLQDTSLRRRGRGAQEQAIGRSRGGRTTRIHAVANASGRLIAFNLTAGQMGDVRSAAGLFDKLPKAAQVLTGTAYDSDKFANS
jgi:hypothetical protein